MKLFKSIIILMMMGTYSYASDSNEQTEAVAISNRHQAGIVKNVGSADSGRFGGYTDRRRGDEEKAKQIFNEIWGKMPSQTGDSKATD